MSRPDPIVENVEFMLSTGEWPARIATRLGMDVKNLSRALYRGHRPDLARVFGNLCREKKAT